MARYLQQLRASLSSPEALKPAIPPSKDGKHVRYNVDLLPSPPGRYSTYRERILY